MRYNLPDIEYTKIRAYSKTQHNGFEQLCAELFLREFEDVVRAKRIEGAGGDGGLEIFVDVPGIGKVGMQAKFFETLQPAQWRQIDKSVKSASKNHPDLTVLRFYVPFDRNPSQQDNWEKKLAAWKTLWPDSAINFEWWGATEIGERLKKPANHDLLHYWFGARQFDEAWMHRVLDNAIKMLGPRYQPTRNIDAGITTQLDRYMWSPSFDAELTNRYVKTVKSARTNSNTLKQIEDADLSGIDTQALRRVAEDIKSAEFPAFRQRTVKDVLSVATNAFSEADNLAARLQDIVRSESAKPGEQSRHDRLSVDDLWRAYHSWSNFLHDIEYIDLPCLLVSGAAGNGKSHLLAHVAVEAAKRNQPAVLLLGEQFRTSDPALAQICSITHWDQTGEALLGALNVAGVIAGRPSMIFIDALNESRDRGLWKAQLHALALEIMRFPNVRLVVSCRTDFLRLTVPDDIITSPESGFAHIEHHGLGDKLSELVSIYFDSYRIQSRHFPPLLDEFSNPLFLDTFCRAFEGQKLPDGPLTLRGVMDRRITTLSRQLETTLDCDERDVKAAILAVAQMIRDNGGQPVDAEVARQVVNEHSDSKSKSQSLYTHLCSNSLLTETISGGYDSEPIVVVRFAFERFSDYFIAESLLDRCPDFDAFRVAADGKGILAWLTNCSEYQSNRGVASALAILVPERYGVELGDNLVLSDPYQQELIRDDFLDSLPWRSAASISDRTRDYLRDASRYDLDAVLTALLRTATVPDHPLNSDYLHERLLRMKLPVREQVWTIPTSWMSGYEETLPSLIVMWALRVRTDLVSNEQARLVATVLLWFGSSTRVVFRARTAHAAIRILIGRPQVMIQLIEQFDSVDDPYVVERLYAVACGVAMREPEGKGLRCLAKTVYRTIFSGDDVRPHVLLRDYAQSLLSIAEQRCCLGRECETSRFRPPFKSKMPRIIGVEKANSIASSAGWEKISMSTKPESSGWYGDFGRYTMGYSVHNFLSAKLQDSLPEKTRDAQYDDQRAYRWVLQRVKQLGWTQKRFGEYEKLIPYGGRHTGPGRKLERIGKKFQWIALHELLGYLSDHHHMRPNWGDEARIYRGAWNVDARDFDPSGIAYAPPGVDLDLSDMQHANAVMGEYVKSYADPLDDIDLLKRRKDWVTTLPDDPLNLISIRIPSLSNDTHWFVLDGYWNWRETDALRLRHDLIGCAELWIHVRSWIVEKRNRDSFIKFLSKLHFWGNGISGVNLDGGWIGEYPAGDVFCDAREACAVKDSWFHYDDLDVQHTRTTCDYYEAGGLCVPSPQLHDLLNANWSGEGSTFLDHRGEAIALQPSLPYTGHTLPCAVRENALRSALDREGLSIIWAAVGEKRCFNVEKREFVGGVETQISGVYELTTNGIAGEITRHEILGPGSPNGQRRTKRR